MYTPIDFALENQFTANVSFLAQRVKQLVRENETGYQRISHFQADVYGNYNNVRMYTGIKRNHDALVQSTVYDPELTRLPTPPTQQYKLNDGTKIRRVQLKFKRCGITRTFDQIDDGALPEDFFNRIPDKHRRLNCGNISAVFIKKDVPSDDPNYLTREQVCKILAEEYLTDEKQQPDQKQQPTVTVPKIKMDWLAAHPLNRNNDCEKYASEIEELGNLDFPAIDDEDSSDDDDLEVIEPAQSPVSNNNNNNNSNLEIVIFDDDDAKMEILPDSTTKLPPLEKDSDDDLAMGIEPDSTKNNDSDCSFDSDDFTADARMGSTDTENDDSDIEIIDCTAKIKKLCTNVLPVLSPMKEEKSIELNTPIKRKKHVRRCGKRKPSIMHNKAVRKNEIHTVDDLTTRLAQQYIFKHGGYESDNETDNDIEISNGVESVPLWLKSDESQKYYF